MSKTDGFPAGRLAAEFVVVVVGVFLALTADAWWANRMERGEELAALEQLRVDFTANATTLDAILLGDQGIIRSGYALMAMSRDPGRERSPQQVAELLYDLMSVWTFNPVMGGLNSLISSGRLDIVRSNELRVALAAWPDKVADLNENERQEWDNTYTQWLPYLQEREFWAATLRATGALDELAPVDPPSSILSVVDDPYFIELVADRISNTEWILDEMAPVRDGIGLILRLVETELTSR